jgi:hypothetical protein
MNLPNLYKWAGTFLAASGGFWLIVKGLKNLADLYKSCLDLQKSRIDLRLKKIEDEKQGRLIAVATADEIETYAKPRAEFQRAFKSLAAVVALLAIAGGLWAGIAAKRARDDAAAAHKDLEKAHKELEELKKPKTPTAEQAPPPTVLVSPAKTPRQRPPSSNSENNIPEEIVAGPPAIVIRNKYKDQAVVANVPGASPPQLTVEPGTEGMIPVDEGRLYNVNISTPDGTITTPKGLTPRPNVHYVFVIRPPKIQKK